MNIRGYFYQLVMRVAHRYHWHYAPPIYPEGDTQLWCRWCGFRQTIKQQKPTIMRDGIDAVCKQYEKERARASPIGEDDATKI